MATFYVLAARNDELLRWAEANGPPASGNATVDAAPVSRLPSVAEVKRVLGAIVTHDSTYIPNTDRRGIDVELNSRRGDGQGTAACLLITHRSDGNTIEDLTIHESDSELAVEIVKRFTLMCGPLVLLEEESDAPCVVHPRTDVADTVENWLRS
jgi:hypothetical protein